MKSILVIQSAPSESNRSKDLFDKTLGPHYELLKANSAQEGYSIAQTHGPQLIVLDLSSNDSAMGATICQKLRSQTRTQHVPIIVTLSGDALSSLNAMNSLSGSGAVAGNSHGYFNLEKKIELLENGADDCLPHSVDPRELFAKVSTYFRRMNWKNSAAEQLKVGNLALDRKAGVIYLNDNSTLKEIQLSGKRYDLLVYFLERPNQVISRKSLLSDIWANARVTGRTIDSHLVSLRRSLDGFDHEFKGVHGVGYALRPKNSAF